MTNTVKIIYKKYLPESARKFIWQRIFDLRFLVSLPLFIPRQILRTLFYRKTASELKNVIFDFSTDIKFTDNLSLKKFLDESGFAYKEGEYAIYIENNSIIDSINGEILKKYPYTIALKIIKSQELSKDGMPFYCGSEVSDTSSFIVKIAVGSILEKSIISNLLHEYKVTPRVYDIIRIVSGDSCLYAMVVQPVKGEYVYGEAGVTFLEKFYSICEKEDVSIIGGTNCGDFKPETFGNNIIKDETSTYYIDVQNFHLNNSSKRIEKLVNTINEVTHFGGTNPFRNSRYAYQSIPALGLTGKRDSFYRLHKINSFLERNNVNLEDKNILDVGCNLGLFIWYSLCKGAKWCVGADMPNTARVTRRFLNESGFMRFDIIGGDLKQNTIIDKMPDTKFDIVFYMSIELHIGFPDWINKIKFRYFIYEGHEGENLKIIKDKIRKSNIPFKILDEMEMQDGDSRTRPILLCEYDG